MNFELKREEVVLASGETPPESHLLDAVRDLVEGEDNGGPRVFLGRHRVWTCYSVGHHV